MARLDPAPDVLIVQEVERLERYPKLAGTRQPTCRDRAVDPRFPRRGIGIFSYSSAAKLQPVDSDDIDYCFRRYEATRGDLSFQVVGVWTYDTGDRSTAYRQAAVGLRRHADWIKARPTVVAGDFNANLAFKGRIWSELAAELNDLGLISAYHADSGDAHGAEKLKTHFPRGRSDNATHLDYCFVPSAWRHSIQRVEVGAYADWRSISDHAPVIVDFDL